jgi:hypothetical protein
MKKLFTYLLNLYTSSFFGFLLLSAILWLQYFRPRLPRDIPFDLTLMRLILLIWTCLIFIWILKRIIRPKVSWVFVLIYPKIYPYIQAFYKPIMLLDDMIQTKIISDLFIKRISQVLPYITFPLGDLYGMFKVHVIIHFIPRLLLLSLFMIDIFYFNKIALMYYFIWIGLISKN